MSQIFDALHRSEAERSGTDLPDLPDAANLLEAAERQVVQSVTGDDRSAGSKQATERKRQAPGIVGDPFSRFQPMWPSVSPQSTLVCVTAQETLAAEKFRFLGVRLRHLQQKRPLQRVLITSSMPEEGKSTVAANLACALAKRPQQKTLLLEGDLRRPSLMRQFGLGDVEGLSELLDSDCDPSGNIYRLDGLGFWILPAGRSSRNPLELMQSVKLSILMDKLSTWFDWIVIDSPPVLPLADTSIWMRLADGVLLVTRPGKTAKRPLQHALEALEQSKVIGALLNGCREAASGDYYRYYASKEPARQA